MPTQDKEWQGEVRTGKARRGMEKQDRVRLSKKKAIQLQRLAQV